MTLLASPSKSGQVAPPHHLRRGRGTGKLRAAALGALSVLLLMPSGCRRAGDAPPGSLVLVTIDTLRRDHLECYGYGRQTAPRLCDLAAQGAPLDAIAPSPWTKPSTATLLTGLHPLRHQAINREDALPDSATTIAEVLSSNGYRSVGVSGNGWVSEPFGFGQGFAYFTRVQLGDGRIPTAQDVNREIGQVISFLRPPYFLYVHYVDPHAPYAPPFAADGQPLPEALANRVEQGGIDLGGIPMDERERLLPDAVELYDGEIRAVDTALAWLLDRLQSEGLMESTVVIVTSDHGEEFLDHGGVGHGKTLYQEMVSVPLVIGGPGMHGAVADRRVALQDVVPTALDLIGMGQAVPDGLDGYSAVDNAGSEQRSPRELLLHVDFDSVAQLGLIMGSSKLLLGAEPYVKEAFDLEADPAELGPGEAAGSVDSDGFRMLASALADQYNDLASRQLPARRISGAPEYDAVLRRLGYLNAGPSTTSSRTFPPRIGPASLSPRGLRGWERPADGRSCIRTVEPEGSGQLLGGWFPAEPQAGGRWTRGAATMVFPWPRPGDGVPGLVLHASGQNHNPNAHSLRVSIGAEVVAEVGLPAGPFEVETRLEDLPEHLRDAAAAVVTIDPGTVFRPSESGNPDPRTLGVFVSSVCLSGR